MRALGRVVEHDPKSRGFAITATPATRIHSVAWTCHAPIFDQDHQGPNESELGSCTANAGVGMAMTEPFVFRLPRELAEADVVPIYSAATRLDSIPGHYPPDDTGSSGLAVCKAMKRAGLITGYKHAFSFNSFLAMLMRGAAINGFNWYEGFDKPKRRAGRSVCELAGDVRGGHEVCALRLDVPLKLVGFRQSWGPEWGDHGYFWMAYETVERLLDEQGDATQLVIE